MEDLEEAVTYYRETLALHSAGHPDRPSSLFLNVRSDFLDMSLGW
jgi:hypothetical protein